MEQEKKKFYELTEEEQKEQMERFFRKVKPIVKRVFLAIFCVTAILLMLFSLIGSGVFEGAQNSEAIKLLLK